MNTKTASVRGRSRSILGAAVATAVAIGVFVALPPKGSSPPQLLEFLGRFHTLAVHLPVGVLLLVASAEVLTRSPRLRARIDPSLELALPFLVATAVVAFSLGALLARGGGYPPKLVNLHRAFTLCAVLGSAACMVAWSLRERSDGTVRRAPYRVALAATVGLLTIGAHFGGSMTHGESYLTHYAPEFVQGLLGAPPPAPAASAASATPGVEPLVFANAIVPLLQRECVECHGPDKTKGGLRLDSLAAILKGGENGPAVVVGHAADSSLVKRLRLPPSDDDHMPPSEKPQPSAAEIALLSWWIDAGASETLRVREVLVPEGARSILGNTLGLSGASEPDPAVTQPAAPVVTTPAPSATPAASTAPSASTSPRLVYRDLVAPLLSARCGRCHGADKQKGKLRVDSLASLLAGGKGGPGIVRDHPSAGSVLTRVRLAPDSDKHMPPSDEPQLTASELQLLSWWAQNGASESVSADALPGGLARIGTGGTRRSRQTVSAATPSAAPTGPSPQTSATPAATTAATAASVALPHITAPPGHVALYQDVVAPILAKRCGECHSGGHTEGGMRVDDVPGLIKNEDLVPGKPAGSPLVRRMVVALGDSDHMPPEGKAQPTASEIAAIELWVSRGGTVDQITAVNEVPADLVPAGARSPATAVAAVSGDTPDHEDKPPGSTVPLRASGCGACTVGSAEKRSTLPVALGALLVTALGARRRATAPVGRRARSRSASAAGTPTRSASRASCHRLRS